MNKIIAQGKRLSYLHRHGENFQFDEHGWREVSDLKIDAKQMREDGLKFYLSNNGVWLTEYVAAKYITESFYSKFLNHKTEPSKSIIMEKKDKRYTPGRITSLAENEIFVFGSNLAGAHGGGAARLAYNCFGAVWGQGVGLQGQSYAIPTMQGGVDTIKPYVDEFIRFAEQNRQLTFLVTRIGCGIAGFRDEEIAPLFKAVIDAPNVVLPREFAECIEGGGGSDKFHLDRFLKAQEYSYPIACQEVEDGMKVSHWIWYIFPQLSILGRSHNAKYYGISGREEAAAYLNHPVLGERLRHITKVLLTHTDSSLQEIFGGLDAMKVCSCMTLFDAVAPDDVFDEVLSSFPDARVDKKTQDYM